LSVAARQSSIRCDCRVGGRPASASLAFKGRATAVAFDVHLEDGGVMNEAVDDSDRHCLVREDFAPFAEGLVGGDEERTPLVAGADELKEHAGFGLVFGDVGDVIEDQEVEFVELGNSGFERELTAAKRANRYRGCNRSWCPNVNLTKPATGSRTACTIYPIMSSARLRLSRMRLNATESREISSLPGLT
jgi:hypothetical protein